MSLDIKKMRQELAELAATVNIYVVARDQYGLDVDESLDSESDVIEQCVAVEYENQFN